MIQSVLLMLAAVFVAFSAWINFETAKRLCRGLKDLSATMTRIHSLPETKDAGGLTTKVK
jgi:hypothetical protein